MKIYLYDVETKKVAGISSFLNSQKDDTGMGSTAKRYITHIILKRHQNRASIWCIRPQNVLDDNDNAGQATKDLDKMAIVEFIPFVKNF